MAYVILFGWGTLKDNVTMFCYSSLSTQHAALCNWDGCFDWLGPGRFYSITI